MEEQNKLEVKKIYDSVIQALMVTSNGGLAFLALCKIVTEIYISKCDDESKRKFLYTLSEVYNLTKKEKEDDAN